LLASTAGPQLPRPVAERIVAETGGNPLALIEIGQELASGELASDSPLPEPVPLGHQLEQRYLREVQGLPADTQSLLLAAAADPTGDPGLLWQAGKDLGFTIEAAATAEARQLITIRDTVRFRHPLVRSAVYYGASFAQRQRVHARLAEATSPAEPDRRHGIWPRPPLARTSPLLRTLNGPGNEHAVAAAGQRRQLCFTARPHSAPTRRREPAGCSAQRRPAATQEPWTVRKPNSTQPPPTATISATSA